MENISHGCKLGLSVNASGSFQTSTAPSQDTLRPSFIVENTSSNIAFIKAPNIPQMIFQENGKNYEMKCMTSSAQPQPQPVILGNVNAANFFTAALGSKRENNIALTPEMMGISALNNSNSFIGIVPVFIQRNSGSWLEPNIRPTGDSKDAPALLSQVVGAGGCQSSIENTKMAESTQQCNQNPPPSLKGISSSDQQSALSSSDTVRLHSLSSQDTIRIPSQSTANSSELNIFPLQIPSISLNHPSFSLLSNIYDRNISLTSIPTVSLFSPPEQSDHSCVPTFTSIVNKENTTSDLQASCDYNACSEEAQLKLVQENSRKVRERRSESEPSQLHIDESADSDLSSTELIDSETPEDKENNLTRSDTVILDEESLQTREHNSAMTTSDTVILPNNEHLEKSKSRSSEGFIIDSVHQQLSESSAETPGQTPSPSSISNLVLTSQSSTSTSIKLDAFHSIPSLILTESIANGTYNPNFLCSLLSQTGNIQQPTFLTNVTLNQAETETLTELTPLQSDENIMQNIHETLPKSCQEEETNDEYNIFCDSHSSSAKGTQTDWVFGNASIYFKPVTMSENENKEKQSVAESSSNVPSSIVLYEDNEDVMNGPLILDEQAVPASILNLIQPHVTLFNSTANMPQAYDSATTTVVQEDHQSGDSEPLFPCTSCDQAFLTKQELKKHMKEHRQVLKCDLCTSTFTRMGNYKRHRKIHNLHSESQNVYTCEHCNRDFLQRCDLRRHMLIHTKQEPHRCSLCGKGYIRRSDLVVHTRFHKRERTFKCSMCDKSFYQSGDLGRHFRRAHNPGSQLTCGHCDRKYACESTLIRHMKVVHKDIILKTVSKRLQEKKGDELNLNNQDLLFPVNDSDANQEQNSEVS